MSEADGIQEQRGEFGSTLAWIVAAACLVSAILLSGYAVRVLTGVPASLLYRDANAIAHQPFYYGLLEDATSSILLMSGAILGFETIVHHESGSLRPFLAALGLAVLTILLGLDDLIMIHESAPYLGLTEESVLAFYAVLLLLALALQPIEVMRPRAILLGIALAALALAGMEDLIGLKPLGIGLEDYLEIVGFSFWSVYMISRAVADSQAIIQRR